MTQRPEGEVTRARQGPVFVGNRTPRPESLADVLERVLDKGIVIVGDIQVRLLDIELLTIKLRLMIASVDRAREMGINWWEGDPFVNTLAESDGTGSALGPSDRERELQQRVEALEQRLADRGPEKEERHAADGGRR
ncbi:MAG TPA: gas vesicle protein [Marmoricola sp.]|nr:gas vesicle protein [Marmoricola sp.]